MGRLRLVLLVLAACSDPAAMPDAGIDAAHDSPSSVIAITPSAFNFGQVELGTSTMSPSATFAVRNTSDSAIDIATIAVGGSHPSDFAIHSNVCIGRLDADASCTLVVAFDPTARDMRTALLEVTGPELATAYLQGSALVLDEALIFDPPARDFGDVGVGETTTFVFSVLNESPATTFTTAIEPPGAFSLQGTTCTTVPLHGTCTVSVDWAPSYSGRHTASLRLSAGNDSWAAGLVGTTSRPLAITPDQGTLGSMLVGQPEGTFERTFTITNTSTTTSSLTATFTGAAADDYEVVANGCTTLAENASCDVVVRLDPTTSTRGSKVAQLVIADGTSTVAARANLTGSAYTVLISGTEAFPNTTSGQQSAIQMFTIINASSRATGALATNLGADFSIASNTCAAGLAANSSCAIGIRFTPSSAGAKQATLQLSGTPGGTDSATLTGTGL